MNDNSMENKMKDALESLYTICLGADGVAAQQRIQARENIDALRMLCAYQTFDVEATRREIATLRALIKGKKKPRRKESKPMSQPPAAQLIQKARAHSAQLNALQPLL